MILLHYLKTSFREFNKYRVQAIISILSLAVSLLCFSLCLYCCRYMLSVDTCFTNYKQIAELQLHSQNRPFSGTPALLIEDLQRHNFPEIKAFTRITYLRDRSYNVVVKEDKVLPYTFATFETDSTYNTVFTPTVLAGSWEEAAQATNSVIMAESTALKVFGQIADAVGKQIILNRRLNSSPQSTPKTGGISYTIKAVIRDLPDNASANLMQRVDILTLNDTEGLFNSDIKKEMTGCYSYALLQKDRKPSDLDKHFRSVGQKFLLYKEGVDVKASLIGTSDNVRQSILIFSWTTGVAGFLILLAGLLNFFHFLTGSFLNRIREYSIRKVAGSNSKQLFGLLFTQAALLLTFAFLLMLCLLELFSPELELSISESKFTFSQAILAKQTMQYFVLALMFSAMICAVTSWRIQNISVQAGIRGGKRKQGKHYVRNLMLGLQLIICWIFVVLAAALYLQYDKTTTTLFGTLSKTDKNAIFSISLDYTFMKNEEKLDLANRLRQHAGVEDLLLADISYTHGVSGTGMELEKDNDDSYIGVNVLSVPSNFFSFMHIPIQAGRTIETTNEMLADQRLTELHPKESQIGKTLYSNSTGYTICGIISEFSSDVYNSSEGFVFLPSDFTQYVGHCYIKSYSGHEKAVKQWIRQVLYKSLPSSVTPRIQTLQEDINEKQSMENMLKGIVLFFSIVCLSITLLGVYSAITLDTEYRRKEVAIRKINGAGIGSIMLLFARLYTWLLIGSAVIALPLVALVLHFWKRMYAIFFNDGVLFWASIFLTITAIVAGTVISRILLIARTNPAKVIKSE